MFDVAQRLASRWFTKSSVDQRNSYDASYKVIRGTRGHVPVTGDRGIDVAALVGVGVVSTVDTVQRGAGPRIFVEQ